MESAQQFLNDIHGEDTNINFRIIKDGQPVKKFNGQFNDQYQILKQFNEQGFNIYFVVNGGGDEAQFINKINAVFIDWDAGRDENKNYKSLEEVKQFKESKLNALREFEYKPSYIVETRNGLHVYWLLYSGVAPEDFIDIQYRLIERFESDKAIKDLSRIMRVPSTNWTKDSNNPYMTTIIERNEIDGEILRYDIEEFMDLLPDGTEFQSKYDDGRLGGTNNKEGYLLEQPSLLSVPPNLNRSQINRFDIVKAFKSRDSEYLKCLYQLPLVTVTNNQEYMNYIRSIDLNFILGIKSNRSFKCIFHNDSSPSATIFKSYDGGYLYKCHSGSCGVLYNILNIVEKLGGFKSRSKAHDFIREILNVRMAQSEWQKEQIQNLDYNIEFLTLNIKDEAPQLYSVIRYQIDYLIKLNLLAKQYVMNERLTDDEGNIVFFASLTELLKVAELSEKQRKKITDKNAVLQYHYLLNKLSNSEIPDDMLKRAEAIQVSHKLKKRVNFYSLPSYTSDLIEDATNQAKKWKDNAYTVKGTSREMFYRKEGQEIAEWLYPQHSHVTTKDGEIVERTTTKKQDEIQSQIVRVIMNLINEKGYCTEKEIIECAAISKNQAQKYIKVNLPEILDLYNLKRVRANKELKEKFGIVGKASPFLLLKNE